MAGLFWVKDNNGADASPASVRQIPGNDRKYVDTSLSNRILFAPGAFLNPSQGIWWTVAEIKAFKQQGFVGLKLWPHGAIFSSDIPKIHEQLDEAGKQGVPLLGYHAGDPGSNTAASKARDFYIIYRDRILFGSDVFAAGSGASAILNEQKLLETNQMTAALHGGAVLQGLNLPDSVLNHIYYWNAARLIPRVRTVLKARGFRIGYELGKFKFDRLPPDVTVSNLTIKASLADLTGTLNSVTDSLAVEINGKVYPGIDNKDGTWKLAGANFSGLPVGIYDVKVTAKNSLGLLRTDTTKNELTIESAIGVALSHKNTDQEIHVSHLTGNKYRVHFPFSCAYILSVYDSRGLEEASYKGVGPSFTYLDFSNKSPGLKLLKINYAGKIAIRKIIRLEP